MPPLPYASVFIRDFGGPPVLLRSLLDWAKPVAKSSPTPRSAGCAPTRSPAGHIGQGLAAAYSGACGLLIRQILGRFLNVVFLPWEIGKKRQIFAFAISLFRHGHLDAIIINPNLVREVADPVYPIQAASHFRLSTQCWGSTYGEANGLNIARGDNTAQRRRTPFSSDTTTGRALRDTAGAERCSPRGICKHRAWHPFSGGRRSPLLR
jgi:hypothetical protein